MYCFFPKNSEKEIVAQSFLIFFLRENLIFPWSFYYYFLLSWFDVNHFLDGFEILELFWMQKSYGYFYVLELQIKLVIICVVKPYRIKIQYAR